MYRQPLTVFVIKKIVPVHRLRGSKTVTEYTGWGNISISQGIPTASPFCKGGLRGIFLIQPGFFENLQDGMIWTTGIAFKLLRGNKWTFHTLKKENRTAMRKDQ
jgi:hypothetical protein